MFQTKIQLTPASLAPIEKYKNEELRMKFSILLSLGAMAFCFMGTGCASSSDRKPTSTSRSGRPYKEPRAMNHRSLDTESLYQACLRERPEASCRNRLGR